MRKPTSDSIVFSASLFILLSCYSFVSMRANWPLFYAKILWSLAISSVAFFIYRTGMISKYRSILFILISFFFLLKFKCSGLFSAPETVPPYCHIAQAPTLLNFIHSQFLAITSGAWKTWGVLTLGFLWLLIMLTIGQGICSWVCFYGGIDEACSKLRKKPLIQLNVSKSWRDFPLAFLIFLLILSFLESSPVFCNWFCPFKLTTAFWDSEPVTRLVQTVLFWLVLIFFLIVFPILTKKRTFCSFLCPFGALVSICGKASPYRVRINQETCTRCGNCQKICPIFAVETQKSNDYKISSYCNRCGKCIDICPVNAIAITSNGDLVTLPVPKQTEWQIEIRDIFVFLSLLITDVLSGTFVPQVILQLLGIK